MSDIRPSRKRGASGQLHKIDTLGVLAVFFLFLIAALLAVTLGSGVYGGIQDRTEETAEVRTLSAYLHQKVSTCEGPVSVTDFEGCSALLLPMEAGGKTYVTKLYVYDGELRELFFEEGASIPPEEGTPVESCASMTFTALPDGLILAEGAAGDDTPVKLFLRAGAGNTNAAEPE